METWYQFVNIVNSFLRCSYVSLLTIIVGSRFFQNKPAVTYATIIIKWIMILGACVIPLTYAAELILSWYSGVEYYQFVYRAAGPYWWAYWLMLTFGVLLPLMLLFKPLGRKLWFLLTVALLMNFGWLFERLIIILTSLHRDYIPSSWTMFYPSLFGWIFLQGIIVGLLALFIGNFIAKQKAKKLSPSRL